MKRLAVFLVFLLGSFGVIIAQTCCAFNCKEVTCSYNLSNQNPSNCNNNYPIACYTVLQTEIFKLGTAYVHDAGCSVNAGSYAWYVNGSFFSSSQTINIFDPWSDHVELVVSNNCGTSSYTEGSCFWEKGDGWIDSEPFYNTNNIDIISGSGQCNDENEGTTDVLIDIGQTIPSWPLLSSTIYDCNDGTFTNFSDTHCTSFNETGCELICFEWNCDVPDVTINIQDDTSEPEVRLQGQCPTVLCLTVCGEYEDPIPNCTEAYELACNDSGFQTEIHSTFLPDVGFGDPFPVNVMNYHDDCSSNGNACPLPTTANPQFNLYDLNEVFYLFDPNSTQIGEDVTFELLSIDPFNFDVIVYEECTNDGVIQNCVGYSNNPPNLGSNGQFIDNYEVVLIENTPTFSEYYFVVDGLSNTAYSGDGEFLVSMTCGDLCDKDRTPIKCGDSITGNTSNGKNESSVYCDCIDKSSGENDTRGNWGKEDVYELILSEETTIDIALEMTGQDYNLNLYVLSLLEEEKNCLYNSSNLGDGVAEQMTITLPAGTYLIVVEGFRGDQGAYTLSIECGSNEDCEIVDCIDFDDQSGGGSGDLPTDFVVVLFGGVGVSQSTYVTSNDPYDASLLTVPGGSSQYVIPYQDIDKVCFSLSHLDVTGFQGVVFEISDSSGESFTVIYGGINPDNSVNVTLTYSGSGISQDFTFQTNGAVNIEKVSFTWNSNGFSIFHDDIQMINYYAPNSGSMNEIKINSGIGEGVLIDDMCYKRCTQCIIPCCVDGIPSWLEEQVTSFESQCFIAEFATRVYQSNQAEECTFIYYAPSGFSPEIVTLLNCEGEQIQEPIVGGNFDLTGYTLIWDCVSGWREICPSICPNPISTFCDNFEAYNLGDIPSANSPEWISTGQECQVSKDNENNQYLTLAGCTSSLDLSSYLTTNGFYLDLQFIVFPGSDIQFTLDGNGNVFDIQFSTFADPPLLLINGGVVVSNNLSLNVNTWNDLLFKYEDSEFSVFVNGSQIYTQYMAEFPGTMLTMMSTEIACVDNVCISKCAEEPLPECVTLCCVDSDLSWIDAIEEQLSATFSPAQCTLGYDHIISQFTHEGECYYIQGEICPPGVVKLAIWIPPNIYDCNGVLIDQFDPSYSEIIGSTYESNLEIIWSYCEGYREICPDPCPYPTVSSCDNFEGYNQGDFITVVNENWTLPDPAFNVSPSIAAESNGNLYLDLTPDFNLSIPKGARFDLGDIGDAEKVSITFSMRSEAEIFTVYFGSSETTIGDIIDFGHIGSYDIVSSSLLGATNDIDFSISEWHDVEISYDLETDQMWISIDGEIALSGSGVDIDPQVVDFYEGACVDNFCVELCIEEPESICYVACCEDSDNTWLIDIVSTVKENCEQWSNCNNAYVAQAKYDGECVYLVKSTDPPGTVYIGATEPGPAVYDCQGNLLGEYGGDLFFGQDSVDDDLVTDIEIIWDGEDGWRDECPQPCVGDVKQDCELFESYTVGQDVSTFSSNWIVEPGNSGCLIVQESNQNKYLELSNFCNGVYTLANSVSEDRITYSMDLWLEENASFEFYFGNFITGTHTNVSTASFGFYSYGLVTEMFYDINFIEADFFQKSIPLQEWFSFEIIWDPNTTEIWVTVDGDLVVNTKNSGITELTEVDFHSTSIGIGRVDNICEEICIDDNAICYYTCCEGEDRSWQTALTEEWQSDCISFGNCDEYQFLQARYDGQCVFISSIPPEPGIVYLWYTDFVYDCSGNIIGELGFRPDGQVLDPNLIADEEIIWEGSNGWREECPTPCEYEVATVCEIFEEFEEGDLIADVSSNWDIEDPSLTSCAVVAGSGQNQYLEISNFCNAVYDVPQRTGVERDVFSMDLLIYEGELLEFYFVTEIGPHTNFNYAAFGFQVDSGTPEVFFDIDGVVYQGYMETDFPIGEWFNFELIWEPATGHVWAEMNGYRIVDVIAANLAQIAIIDFHSYSQGANGVDNICINGCLPEPEVCYESCCVASDLSWLDNLSSAFLQICESNANCDETYITQCMYQGECVYIAHDPDIPGIILLEYTDAVYDCDGSLVGEIGFKLDGSGLDYADFSNCEVIWSGDSGWREECCEYVEQDHCEDFEKYLDEARIDEVSALWTKQDDYISCLVQIDQYQNNYLEIKSENGDFCQAIYSIPENIEDEVESISYFIYLTEDSGLRSILNYNEQGQEIQFDITSSTNGSEIQVSINDVIQSLGVSETRNVDFPLNQFAEVVFVLDKETEDLTLYLGGVFIATIFDSGIESLNTLSFVSDLSSEVGVWIDDICEAAYTELPHPCESFEELTFVDFNAFSPGLQITGLSDWSKPNTNNLSLKVSDELLGNRLLLIEPENDDDIEVSEALYTLDFDSNQDYERLAFDLYFESNLEFQVNYEVENQLIDFKFRRTQNEVHLDLIIEDRFVSKEILTDISNDAPGFEWFKLEILQEDDTDDIWIYVDDEIFVYLEDTRIRSLQNIYFTSLNVPFGLPAKVDNIATYDCNSCTLTDIEDANFACDMFEFTYIQPEENATSVTFTSYLDGQQWAVIDQMADDTLLIDFHENQIRFDFEGENRIYEVCFFYEGENCCPEKCCKQLVFDRESERIRSSVIATDDPLLFTYHFDKTDRFDQVVSWWEHGVKVDMPYKYLSNGQYEMSALSYNSDEELYNIDTRDFCIDNPFECERFTISFDNVTQEYTLEADEDVDFVEWNIDIPKGSTDYFTLSEVTPFSFSLDDYPELENKEIVIGMKYLEDDCYKICANPICTELDEEVLCEQFNVTYEILNDELVFEVIGVNESLDYTLNVTDPNLSTFNIGDLSYSSQIDGEYAFDITYSSQCGDDVNCQVVTCASFISDCGFSVSVNNAQVTLLANDLDLSNYQWDYGDGNTEDGTGSIIHNYEESGTYTICLSHTNVCDIPCQECSEVSIDLPELIVNEILENPSCENISNGSIRLEIEGGEQPYEILWEDGSTQINRFNLSAGTYAVTITDALETSVSLSIVLVAPPLPELVYDIEDAGCDGENGSVEFSVTNGVQIQSYRLIETGTVNISGFFDNLESGSYTFEIRDENNCFTEIEILVEEDAGFELDLGEDIMLCENEEITISTELSNAFEHTWYLNGSALSESSNTLLINVPGLYRVEVNNGSDCVQSDQISLDYFEAQDLNFMIDDESCLGGDGSISNSNNGVEIVSFTLNPGNLTSSNGIFDGLEGGNYILTVLDVNDCSEEYELEIGEQEAIIVSLQSSYEFCQSDEKIIESGFASDYQFSWFLDGELLTDSGPNLNVTQSGTYLLEVTGEGECVGSDETIVTVYEAPNLVSEIVNPACGESNGIITITSDNGIQLVNFTWNPLGVVTGTNTYSGLSEGEYEVIVLDQNGCTSLIEVELNESAPIALSISTTLEGCDNVPNIIDSGLDSDEYTFEWYFEENLLNETGSQLEVSETGVYTLVVYESEDCSVSESIDVTIYNSPEVSIEINNPSCGNTDGSIDVSNTSDAIISEYEIPELNLTSSQGNFENLPVGSYTLLATTEFGCIQETMFSLENESEIPMINLGPNIMQCFGTDVILGTGVQDNTYTTQWFYEGVDLNVSTSNLTVGLSGTYTVLVTNDDLCERTDSIEVVFFEEVMFDVEAVQPSCGDNNGSISLSQIQGNAIENISWGDVNANPNGLSAENLGGGIYQIVATDVNGCFYDINITLDEENTQPISLGEDIEECGIEEVNLDSGLPSNGFSFQWSLDDQVISETQNAITVNTSGLYAVTATNEAGCQVFGNIEVTLVESNILLPADIFTTEGELIMFEVEGSIMTQWSSSQFDLECTDCLSNETIVNTDGEIEYIATDNNGCVIEGIINVFLNDSEFELINMITPNGDNSNDVLEIEGLEQYEPLTLFIYNRWGVELLEIQDYKQDWQGMINGEPLPDGVYYYVIEYTLNDQVLHLKSDLLIVRN